MTGEQLGIPPALLDPAELPAAARAYCAHGWSVIPAAAVGKRALVPWKAWQQTQPDLELVDRWWRRWPAANVAIVTGRLSGLVVVDVDVRHGGDRALAILEATHGDLPWLAVAETPSGGWHAYLAWPGFKVANSAGRLGPGLDVRGQGGLVLAPPSRRGLGAYRWAVGGPTTVPAIPTAWRKLLRPRQPKVQTAAVADFPLDGRRDAARLAGLLRTLERAPEGQRNNALYWCGRRLVEMVDQGAPASWRRVLAEAAKQRGLEAAEVAETLNSAMGPER